MMMKHFLFLLLLAISGTVWAQEAVNQDLVDAIRKHGLDEGQVMDVAANITDVYGPRLTGSPMLEKATDWAVSQLKEWGLENVHTEEWGPFGRGWELERFEAHAHTPNYWPLLAVPKAWSASTDGEVTAEVIYLEANTKEELDTYKGKLKGKFVLLDTLRFVEEWFDAPARRYNSEDLLEMANAQMPTPRPRRNYDRTGFSFNKYLWEVLEEEEPIAVLDRSYKGDLGTIFVSGARTSGSWGDNRKEGQKVLPQATLSVEHYNRLFRLVQRGMPVTISMNLKARYYNPDEGMERNIIAEIPGTRTLFEPHVSAVG
jgi:carboxypeptidase Q